MARKPGPGTLRRQKREADEAVARDLLYDGAPAFAPTRQANRKALRLYARKTAGKGMGWRERLRIISEAMP